MKIFLTEPEKWEILTAVTEWVRTSRRLYQRAMERRDAFQASANASKLAKDMYDMRLSAYTAEIKARGESLEKDEYLLLTVKANQRYCTQAYTRAEGERIEYLLRSRRLYVENIIAVGLKDPFIREHGELANLIESREILDQLIASMAKMTCGPRDI